MLHLQLTPYIGALFSQGNGEHGMKILLKLIEGIEHTCAQLSSSTTPVTRYWGGL